MKHLNESIHTGKGKDFRLNMVEGSVGSTILKHEEDLAKCATDADIEKFLDIIENEVGEEFKKDCEELRAGVKKQKWFIKKFRYLYNYVLAGDNLRA